MGKASLLFVAATVVAASFLMYGQQRASVDTDQQQATYQEVVLARKAAEAGLNMAVSRVKRDFDSWREGYENADFEGGGFDVDLEGTAAGPVLVSATGNYGGAAHQAQATVARLAPTPAAIIVDADTAEVSFLGNNFLVSGMDARPGSSGRALREGNGAGEYVNGVWTHSPQVRGAFFAAATGDRADNVRGTKGTLDIVDEQYDKMEEFPIRLGELYEQAQEYADVRLGMDAIYNDRVFGSADDPQIVVSAGSVTFTGETKGYGLLIVRGNLAMLDDFEWEGIVVAQSYEEEMDVLMTGNAAIYGSLIMRRGLVDLGDGDDEEGGDDDQDTDDGDQGTDDGDQGTDDGDQGTDDNEDACDCETPSGPPSGTYPDPGKPDKKVIICHVPPGSPSNAHSISISKNAHGAHMDHHDDYDGYCLPACSCSTSDASPHQDLLHDDLPPLFDGSVLPVVSERLAYGIQDLLAAGLPGRMPGPALLSTRLFEAAAVLISGCEPSVAASFTSDGKNVTTTSTKDLSNVVLHYADGVHQKFEGLHGKTLTFAGTGSNAGKVIVGVWIKSGCNHSGDGPGYGEYVENPIPPGDDSSDSGDDDSGSDDSDANEDDDDEGGSIEDSDSEEEERVATPGVLRFTMRNQSKVQYSTEAIGKLAARLSEVRNASWVIKFDQISSEKRK